MARPARGTETPWCKQERHRSMGCSRRPTGKAPEVVATAADEVHRRPAAAATGRCACHRVGLRCAFRREGGEAGHKKPGVKDHSAPRMKPLASLMNRRWALHRSGCTVRRRRHRGWRVGVGQRGSVAIGLLQRRGSRPLATRRGTVGAGHRALMWMRYSVGHRQDTLMMRIRSGAVEACRRDSIRKRDSALMTGGRSDAVRRRRDGEDRRQ